MFKQSVSRLARGITSLSILCLFTLNHPCLAAGDEPIIAIKAGRIIDTDSGQVLRNQTIIVRGSTIEKVGSAESVPKGARVIDLSGETVLPGLIDCHTHLTDETYVDPVMELRKTGAEKVLEAIPHAKRTLMAGFTTVRDVGTYRALIDCALRDAIARGDVVGPRLFVAGAYVTITGGGGSMSGFAPDITIPWDLKFGQADGPWQVRQRVRELAHRGVDFIKVLATGAVLTHGSNPAAQEFTLEEMQAAVDEAKKFGLKVAAHAHSASGIKDAVRAGVASIEHGTFLDDEGIALMKEKGTYLVGDIYNEEYIQGEGKARGMPADFLEHDRDLGRIQRENFKRAAQAGVRMAFGTDAGIFPHGMNAKQFAWMVKYGLTPMQAIQSATIQAARLLGKDNQLGCLKPGYKADIVAVSGDPIEDVTVLEKVDFVMKDGQIFKQQ
ncbi:MAG: amidohydrolase family protein [Cyanobacteria bacterium]|nr:amidohydrolase family protein [Cyanobacteriota bacterium]